MSEQQLVIFICGLIAGLVIGRGIGFCSGYNLGMKIARQWEGIARDWRASYESEMADTEHQRQAILEVRELKRIHDGY